MTRQVVAAPKITLAICLGLAVVCIIVLIYVAVANRHLVVFSLDPLGGEEPFFATEIPLFVLLFAAVFLGLVIGGTASWLNQGKWRKAARQGLSEAEHWRKEATRPPPEGTAPPSTPASGQLPAPQ